MRSGTTSPPAATGGTRACIRAKAAARARAGNAPASTTPPRTAFGQKGDFVPSGIFSYGGGSFSGAFDDEDNGSGHLVGLKFSVPLGCDERDARYKRRRLETIQQERQVLAVISTILAEVDVSANEYIISTQDLYARRQAQLAAQRDLVTLRDRWNDGVGQGQSIAIFSALLDAYERVQLSEEAVATARATREISAANLARARGVLLARWGLQTEIRNEIRNEPTYKLTNQN